VDTEIEDISDSFLRALHCLQQFVRAYRLSTGTPIMLPTYQRIGPHVLLSRRGSVADGQSWEHYTQRLNQEVVPGQPPGVATPEVIARWHDGVQLLSAGDVRALVEDTVVDAHRLLTRDGDYAGAVLKAAQAAEVLLDGLLGLLLWEDCGGAPDHDGAVDIAAGVLKNDLRPRLRNAYHTLLGGSWDLSRPGPLADWDRLVAGPRNRIVHRGYTPRAAEAANSLTSLRALDSYLMGLVAAALAGFLERRSCSSARPGLSARAPGAVSERSHGMRGLMSPLGGTTTQSGAIASTVWSRSAVGTTTELLVVGP
jgi:hypothetical protein